jgi:hypothetical protein
MPSPSKKKVASFAYRGGVRIQDTILTCDATGASSDLVFLSHAQAIGVPGRGRLALRRAARQQLLVTEATLSLLGRAGERLRPHALPTAFGRPFTLGEMRIELFPSGYLPGAASLLCEVDQRRIVYAGTIGAAGGGVGAGAPEVRAGDAVCLDATFGSNRFEFPPREEALAQVRGFIEAAIAAGRAPVFLVSPFGTSLEVARAIASAGFGLRGHRAIVAAAAAFRAAGVATPAIARFAGSLGAREVVLWPPEMREAAFLRSIANPAFAFVSGFSKDPGVLAQMKADVGIALANQAGFSDLLAYVEATGASEVALCRGYSEELAATLRQRGLDAYALGAPSQMDLFRG